MSTPQGPYGPQNPYGQQFPQAPQGPYAPGPYGQQQPYGAPPVQQPQPQQQPQYGNPYPQQPPYGAPFPQQQPYGWGAPPVAPPPKRRPLMVILAVVGGLVALGVAGSLMRGVEETGTPFPAAEYTLDLPKTLLDGRYELDQDLSDSPAARSIEKEADGAWGYKDLKAAVGEYTLGGDQAKGGLVVSGMYGQFKHPDRMRESLLSGAARGEGIQLAVSAEDFHPEGADGITVTCEVLTKGQAATAMTVPVCAWGDGNTGAAVAELAPDTMNQDPFKVDLDKAAATTLRIRSEMRKPI
ncbi:hypothetical protein [Streptomyces sp. NPDC005374]|uniref:hypothetical protein n=1 Tax=Streptomyces sp. NPDC005374 TaxID=3364713 RepID=UPI00368FFE95